MCAKYIRLGDTFRWKGENVSTTEVAEVITKTPGVVEANVYGIDIFTSCIHLMDDHEY